MERRIRRQDEVSTGSLLVKVAQAMVLQDLAGQPISMQQVCTVLTTAIPESPEGLQANLYHLMGMVFMENLIVRVSTAPVSYTHLDVYKRQTLAFLQALLELRLPESTSSPLEVKFDQ